MNNIKLIGILHFAGNILSGGLLGTLLVVWFLILRNDLSDAEKKTCYHIINFNISFWIYFAIGWILLFVLIGFLILPIVGIIWIILLVIGFIKHLAGEDYEYPLAITFLK